MSWVKNIWTRIFPDDTEEDEYKAEEWTEEPEESREKAPFRFPLISDEEKEEFIHHTTSRKPIDYPIKKEPERAERPKRMVPSQKPRESMPAAEPIKRRFTPSQVPSPVHGFGKRKTEPKPIEELLAKKDRRTEQPTGPLTDRKQPVVDKTVRTSASSSTGSMPSAETKRPSEQRPLKQAEQQEEKQPEQPQAEQVVAAERKQAVEKPEQVHKPVQENPKPAVPKKGQKREKTVPFNVLMLKSDKERLKKPIAPKQPKTKPAQPTEQPETAAEPEPRPPEATVDHISENSAPYVLPGESYLLPPENDRKDEEWMETQGERLVEALSHFQVNATVLSIVQGPAVTQFELTVAQGVKVSKIRNLADDLKLALAARDIRIQAPIPGKSSIGIEIPNRTSRPVRISEIIHSPAFNDSESPLEAALGLDLTGKPVTLDLRKMPHGLIAGATGSGKSVCINSLLVSLLYKSSPQDLKLLLIDPKMVELAPYNHIPHLVSPVITDVKAATASLKWAVEEMERRYQLFAHTGVRDISRYNKLVKEKGDHAQHLPYILIVIDELADLMMMSPSDVEDAICRIAQKARACGIHLVIATQRPSVDVITGLIKSNIPTRIAFSVSSQVDSRTILDSQGAERLLGRGDMLYLGNGMSAPTRLQGTFVTDEEIEEVINHVRSQGEPEYFFKEEELMKRNDSAAVQDDLFEEACRFLISQGSASTSLLQRHFHIGYNRAARLMDLIEQHGFISEQNGSKARTVLITEDDMQEVFQ
ncbi:DNA translocase FtsK [Planococcus salinus]|uniref:DNA translocase FtsK n=1 Tax=Planococcus salinus TaxID=1848460 RepID=A0A3M8PAQ9_9BACL|nr:DNA translocase FtsK [Planococcus salinus]RNF40805.1 DNA translocase FtsK [Planococcus salinus]